MGRAKKTMNRSWSEYLFQFKGAWLRRYWRLLGRRPNSAPYVSGDSLRALADMIFEPGLNTVRPEAVNSKTIIFVKTELAEKFFREITPAIATPFVLITHNSDMIVDDRLAAAGFSTGKIAKWYSMSVTAADPRLVPLPAGLENLRLYYNGVPSLFNRIRRAPPATKKPRLLFGFNINTNPAARRPAFDFLSKCPLADPLYGWPAAPRYLKRLSEYEFVAAPAGNALDAHRIWEAMYLSVVPVVIRSSLFEYFAGLGLPIWILDDWTELTGLTEADLAERYDRIWKTADTRPLWLHYWADRIRTKS
jgi:hypothetical protein